MTEDYPVTFTFAGSRWVFSCKQDILDLIDEIHSAASDFDQKAA